MESAQQPLLLLTTLLVLGLLVFLRRRSALASLRGPESSSLFSKALLHLISADDIVSLCEKWGSEYGPVFKVPTFFGKSCVVICDTKALSHLVAKDSYTYRRSTFLAAFFKKMLGDTILTLDGMQHKEMRRGVAPAFTITALKGPMEVFYNSVYKVKVHWDTLSKSNDDLTVDVQSWMNRLTLSMPSSLHTCPKIIYRLDTLGIAMFGFDFKTIEGSATSINDALDRIRVVEDPRPFQLFQFMGFIFPFIANLPFKVTKPFDQMKLAFMEIATQVVKNSQKQKDGSSDRSIFGTLLRRQASDTNSKQLYDEVIGQGLFLLEGYETTSTSLTWALIELARHPEIQEKLRAEFRQFSDADPSLEQLNNGLPYLDAFAQEVLRLHSPTEKIFRTAGGDDPIPLSTRVKNKSGKDVGFVVVPKGTPIIVPLAYFDRSESIWGPDAKEFKPERWLGEKAADAKEAAGRLYSFGEGPRMCLGREFATVEFKVIIYVVVKNFFFEFPDGKDTKIVNHRGSHLPRPKVPGIPGCTLPMRVKRISH